MTRIKSNAIPTPVGIVRCDECSHQAPTTEMKPFDPCPKCKPCVTCEHKPDGKMRLMFDYPSGKPSVYKPPEGNNTLK